MPAATGPKNEVVVHPQAFVTMVLHAIRHKYESIHGILLGTCEKNVITVKEAVPVCHGAPTRPLVETAMGLVVPRTIVGWYTAPALLQDTKPGPVALRMTANLETDKLEPILIVIQNAALVASLKGGKAEDVLQALGKDFGKQWLDPLKTTLKDPAVALKGAMLGVEKGVQVADLVDHYDGDASTVWYPNNEIAKLLE